MVGDYYEALEHYREADALLRMVRAQQVRGADAEVDATLDDLKACVDKTREVLEQEATSIDVGPDRSAGDGSDGLEEEAAESVVAKQEETAAATE
jgi:hypothetical protein